MRLCASSCFFERAPAAQASLELRAVPRRDLSKGSDDSGVGEVNSFIALYEIRASGITAGRSIQRSSCAITINVQRRSTFAVSIYSF